MKTYRITTKALKAVRMPSWWTGESVTVYGFTDAIDTYCCSLQAAWFVEVPKYNYSGYFQVRDLELVA